jgi:capsid protein
MVDFPRQWFWDGAEHIDPAKEADAQSTRLANRTTSLAREYARQGLDWESQVEQIARERAKFESLGMAYPGDPPAVAPPPMDQPQSDNSLGDGNASTEDS